MSPDSLIEKLEKRRDKMLRQNYPDKLAVAAAKLAFNESIAIARQHQADQKPGTVTAGELKATSCLASDSAQDIDVLSKPQASDLSSGYSGLARANAHNNIKSLEVKSPQNGVLGAHDSTQTEAECGAHGARADKRCKIPVVDESQILSFLRRKYVTSADDRQKALGLEYLTAETTDLARGLAAYLRVPEPVSVSLEAILRGLNETWEDSHKVWKQGQRDKLKAVLNAAGVKYVD